MKKRLLVIFLLFLLLMPIGLIGLISTESGSRWLLQTLLPSEVSLQTIQGNLLSRLELTGLHYQSPSASIELNKVSFAWQPSKLFSGTLKIVELSLDNGSINLTATQQAEEEKSPFDFNAPLALPLDVIIENLRLTNLQLQQGEQLQTIEKLQLRAKTENQHLYIETLALDAKPLSATVQGQVRLGKGFAFTLQTTWQLNTEQQGVWQATTEISGDNKKINIGNHIASPFNVTLKGIIDNPLTTPNLTMRLDWRDVKYPITGDAPQLQSESGYINLVGLLTDYRLQVNAKLQQTYLPAASLELESNGSLEAINVKKLELTSTTGNLHLDGNIGWKDVTRFDINALASNFNPAIIMPDMAGNLSLDSHFKGQLADKLQLDIAINKLAGQLHGYPVSADGTLLLSGEQLTVNALNFNSGRNKIAVNGTLGQEQATLTIAFDTPALNTLWPTLGGSLKGQGKLQGAWQNPSINFQAKGQGLRFAEHGVEQLNIDIDYDATAKKPSQLQILAKNIHTGATKIAHLLIAAQGSLTQHSLKTDVNSSYGDLSASITGGIKADNWQGDLEKLSITSKDIGLWQLKQAMNIHASKNTVGVDVQANEGCLIQNHSALCVQGAYSANSDFSGQVKIVELPSTLIQAYLPPDIKFSSALNANASVQQKNSLLTGQYQFNTTPSKLSIKKTDLQLGASSITGKLNGTQVSAEFDVALIGQDAVRGQVQLDTGKRQTIAGQLHASVTEFNALKSLVPQLSALNGQLKSNVKLSGLISKPVIDGDVDLNGAMAIAESGLTINDIKLHADITGSNRVALQASLVPNLLLNPNTADQLKVNTTLTIQADLQQQANNFTGHYALNSPPTIINVATTKIPLGASSLSGNIAANKLLADLKLSLIKQDVINGQLQLMLDDSHALSGQLSASLVEFAALNPLVPQVSGLKGQLKANVNLAGTTEKPTANGSVNFNSGAVDLNNLGLELRQMNFQALAATDRIQLKGSAKSGAGQIKLDGEFGLSTQALELLITGENFDVAKLAEAEVAISPQLTVTYAKNHGKVTGKLAIPKAIIKLKEVPESAVQVSSDEVILGETAEQDTKTVAPTIDAAIDIELGKNVNFTGMGLKTDLLGTLQLTKTGEKMAMYGNVDLKKARYKSYGQDLTVRKGQIIFNGATDNPSVNIEATRLSISKKVTAVLSVTGALNSPQIHIYAEPALPETEALAYLITGKPIDQASKSEGNQIASAALSYGAGQASWLTEKLGIDEFEVQEGSTLQNTLLAVGQYLTPDFYVGAKVGLFNKQVSLVLKHKLTESINVETQSGDSQRIKLNYEIDTD